ncbi:MAG: hypothetical protein KDK11_11620 [Maritimibacter sp.]|nr:hypothetical protein [Maritimibacter sp.]
MIVALWFIAGLVTGFALGITFMGYLLTSLKHYPETEPGSSDRPADLSASH